MELNTYLCAVPSLERGKFADSCATSWGHLKNVALGYRPCSPALAVLIEAKSNKAVTRQELCPDWQAIWPELSRPRRTAKEA